MWFFGFNFEKKKRVKFPHIGRVIVENNVQIGSFCTIDRGSLTDTVIGEFTSIDNQVQIAHNVKIGNFCMIAAQSGIAGSTIIGNDVKIYQGVTLGALSVSKDKAEQKRHPTIEDGVIIYANATILGGKTIVGKGSIIGGNVWLTESVPSQTLVFHKSEVIVKDKIDTSKIIDFSI